MSKLTKFWKGFWLSAAILAGVALIGLGIFWVFIDAYEASRPQVTIDAYINAATPEKIAAADTAIPEKCDLNIQKEEQARKVIADSIEKITCLRDPKRTTEEQIVYAVMNGSKRVGSLTLSIVDRDLFGLERWQITEEVYDFSHLLSEAVSVTVPEGYQVFADGVALDEGYVTEKGVQFEVLKSHYDTYNGPTMQTYTTGQILGTPELSVKDQNGAAVDISSDETIQASFVNCTEEEIEAVKDFAPDFVKYYVRFSSNHGGKGMRYINYNNLDRYMVSGGALASRLKSAIDGLYWVYDHNAEVVEIKYHQFIRVEEGVYLCDLTYTVDQKGRSGRSQSDVNLRILAKETEKGLKAENMTVYAEE